MNISQSHVIKVRQATIFQENSAVLNDISFDVQKGEFIYLVGRTGSGKSSLLKTLYADLELKLGDIEVVGYNIHKIKPEDVPFLRRQIGIIFQDFELFYDRSVAENLAFVMRATGWKDKAKIKIRMAEVLMRVGLGAVSNKMPHQLSGGEQQRVVIARALVNEPKILMADEPTGNLDPEVAEGIINLFQEINQSGTSVIMATHYHQFIDKFPQRVLKCENNKILDSNVDDFEIKASY